MELNADRIECSVRLLQNGKYVWTITGNMQIGQENGLIAKLKQMDGTLRDLFPNHVKESSVRFKDFSEEE